MQQQLELYRVVKEYDIEAAISLPSSKWNTLFQCEERPAFMNRGTLIHWAIWHQHWKLISIGVAAGCNLRVKGEGCWMDNKSAAEYAQFLDEKAGHPYYSHVECYETAAANNTISMVLPLVMEKRDLDSHEFLESTNINADETAKRILHDIAEFNSFPCLQRALEHYGEEIMRNCLVGPADNPYNNYATLAHFCVWYQHWDMLRWLQQHGCISLEVKGTGNGWTAGRNVLEYATLLEERCNHPYYKILSEVVGILTPPSCPPTPPTRSSNFSASAPPNTGLCCICLDSPAEYMVVPCNHLCLCSEHAEVIRSGTRQCPLDRNPIQDVVQVFMS